MRIDIGPGNWLSTTNSLDEEVKDLENKMGLLKAQESDNVTAADNEAIQPGKKRKSEFELWLRRVKCKKSEYWLIENELRVQKPSKYLKSRIEKEIKEVGELIQQGRFLNGVVLDDHASRRLPMVTPSLVGQRCAEYVNTIYKLLKEDAVFAIGVHGMGGVGKTTIVSEIHNRLLLDSDIDGKVYWVTASQDCSLEKLQNDIGKVVGLHDFSKQDNERKKALLFQRFSRLGKCVLVIDDLWDSYVMDKIGIPLEASSCKVVITTRKLEVCRRMPCKHVIRILPLNEADSWTLFGEKLKELPRNVEHIAREIVKECGGLPLALITLGCCMRGITEVCEWENALYELRKPASRQDELEVEVFRILKFSFDRLKDLKVQNCSLSCVLFPEDEVIYEVDLVDLWINEGLLDDMETQQDRVNKGHVILNRLVNACLLESNGDGRWVKMHDLIRDMGIIITQKHPLFIAEAGKQLEQVPGEEKWSKDLVKASLSYNAIEEIPSGMVPMAPDLTVLMLNKNPLKKIPKSFFLQMRALTLLDLSRTWIKRAPESVSDLENLRGLLLVDCEYLRYVPSVAKVTKLRILDLHGCCNLKEAPRGLERLEKVEKLSYIPWDVSDLIGFNEVVQCLTSLSCFRFWIRDPNLSISNWDLFDACDNVTWISGVGCVPQTVSLQHSSLVCQGLPDLRSIATIRVPHSFSQLRILDVRSCPKLKVVVPVTCTKQILFPNLESITVHCCQEVEEIFETNKEVTQSSNPILSLPKLKKLTTSFLPKIKVMVPFTEELRLLILESIEVSSCEGLEEVFEAKQKANQSSNPAVSLPNLRSLTLEVLPKIKVIFSFTMELRLLNYIWKRFPYNLAKRWRRYLNQTRLFHPYPIPFCLCLN